jgi:hypothetical protein
MTVFLFGISLLALIEAYKRYRATTLDEYRDKLFDLRGKFRDYYLDHGLNMDSSHYVLMREMLNAHIRYLEETRLTSLAYFSQRLATRKVDVHHLAKQMENSFNTGDAVDDAFSASIRLAAVRVTQRYMLRTSFLVIVTFLPIAVIGGTTAVVRRTAGAWAQVKAQVKEAMDADRRTAPAMIRLAATGCTPSMRLAA